MADTPQLSETKRTLAEKYLRGNLPQVGIAASVSTRQVETEMVVRRERVVAVQVGGSKRPFFFLHGHWKGSAFFCYPLARELGSDQPFYTLEPYQFDGLLVPPTVELMAAAHIESMRSVQPEGPYLLGGWCNGGLVAYEMARQLYVAGQSLDLLVLMDPMYLGYCTRRRVLRWVISRLGDQMGYGQDKQLDWFLRLLYVCKPLTPLTYGPLLVYRRLRNMHYESSQDTVRLIIKDVLNFARRKVMTTIKGLDSMLERARVAPAHLSSLSPTAVDLRQDYLGIFEWIDMGYKPSDPYPGKITFFWPCKEGWHTISRGWRKVINAKEAQKLEAYVIPGSQDTWKADHLHALAERLRMCLGKVQKEMT
jgi:hypothetical protein